MKTKNQVLAHPCFSIPLTYRDTHPDEDKNQATFSLFSGLS